MRCFVFDLYERSAIERERRVYMRRAQQTKKKRKEEGEKGKSQRADLGACVTSRRCEIVGEAAV